MFGAKGPSVKPALLVCYLCGQQFGTASLPIHQTQCYTKKLTEWKSGDKATRGPKPRNPADVDVHAPNKITARNAEEIEEFNQQQFGNFQQQLAQCHNCGRKFFPDRLQVHLRSCKPDASGGGSRPVHGSKFEPKRDNSSSPQREKGFKPQLLVCYLCGQQFGTQSLPIHVPQCYKKKLTQWQNGEPATRGPKPRDPATVDFSMPTSLRNGMDIDAFNQANFDQYNSNLSPCPNCARTFNPSALQVHLRSCKPDASGGGSKPVRGKDGPPAPSGAYNPPKEKGPAQRPLALVCYLCGQQYGSSSLSIHQAQCYKKHLMQWENGDPATRGLKPRDPATVEAPTSLAGANDFNDQAFQHFQQNLSPCPNCGRKFLPDRLQVHLRSCNPDASGGGSKPINHRPGVQQANGTAGQEHSSFDADSEDRRTRPPNSAKYGRRSSNAPSPQASSKYADPDAPLLRDRSQLTPKRRDGCQTPSPTSANGLSHNTDEENEENNDEGESPDYPNEEGELEEDYEPMHVNLVPCSNCGRRFAEQRLEQHESVCQRMKKRKQFNMAKARQKGTGMDEVPTSKATVEAAATTKTGWKEKHEALKAAMKAARDVAKCLAKGGNLADLPPPPPAENPDYIQCPHCSRRFNQTAAERHIPACARTINKPKAPPKRPAAPSPAPTTAPTSSPMAKTTPKPILKSAPANRNGDKGNGMLPSTAKPGAAKPSAAPTPAPTVTARARFCSECGFKYEDHVANFCQECGTRRD